MTAVDLAVNQLQNDEGFKADVYDDGNGAPIITHGAPTIGYGCRCRQWSSGLAQAVLAYQVKAIEARLASYDWYTRANPVRQAALLNLAFNTGLSGLLNGFPKLIAAASLNDWTTASLECHAKDPRLAERYQRLSLALLTG